MRKSCNSEHSCVGDRSLITVENVLLSRDIVDRIRPKFKNIVVLERLFKSLSSDAIFTTKSLYVCGDTHYICLESKKAQTQKES